MNETLEIGTRVKVHCAPACPRESYFHAIMPVANKQTGIVIEVNSGDHPYVVLFDQPAPQRFSYFKRDELIEEVK